MQASEKHSEHSGAYYNTYAVLKRQHDVRNKKTELGIRTGASKCQT